MTVSSPLQHLVPRLLVTLALACVPTLVVANDSVATPNAKTPKIAKKNTNTATKHTTARKSAHNYAKRLDVRLAADAIAQSESLDQTWVRQTLAKAHYIPAIAKAVRPAPKGVIKNWAAYQRRFIEPQRIAAGSAFWQAHLQTLQRAEKTYGVPAEIIVGIIGVETLYGQHTGGYKVLDALATLAFDFPTSHPRAKQRSAYFRQELGQYLKLCQQLKRDPTTLLGSYAGAMGLGQFMPSSWLKYAVDFDGDGKVDLWHSTPDAIGSVANYFKAFGWQTGQPTHFALRFDQATVDKATLLAPDILPTFNREAFTALGVRIDDDDAKTYPGKWALVELFNGDDTPSYVAGTENFYVVTRYNWSSYYALAVIELGQAVAQALKKTP
jgi:membrane-bound lytic murein transglycosylase B